MSCRGRIGESDPSSIAIEASTTHNKPESFFLTLVVDISMTSFGELEKCDWSSFDEYVRTHADDIRKVVLGFKSQDDLKRFLTDIAPLRLSWLLGSGKLAYAVRLVSGDGPQNDKWAYATLKEETLNLNGECIYLVTSIWDVANDASWCRNRLLSFVRTLISESMLECRLCRTERYRSISGTELDLGREICIRGHIFATVSCWSLLYCHVFEFTTFCAWNIIMCYE